MAMAGRGGKRSTSFKPGQSGNPGGRPKAIPAVGQRYRFTLDPDAVFGTKPQITLLPANGIPATLQHR
jgi:Family of unknown function (DUF5681)